MRKTAPIWLLCFLSISVSCNKFIEKKKEDAVIEAMTDGRWYVVQYLAVGNDVTSEFYGYEFQFFSNGTVQGYLNTSVTNGTWAGDMNAMTISASFPGAAMPVSRLSATWKITDNSYYDVTAYSKAGADTNWLRLQKK